KEEAAQIHPIQAADQLAVHPGFYAVRVAGAMQIGIDLLNVRADPGAGGAALRGALADDLLESQIAGDTKAGLVLILLACNLAQLLAQGAGYLEIVHLQHHAWIRRPPQYRVARAVPGKHALTVGF